MSVSNNTYQLVDSGKRKGMSLQTRLPILIGLLLLVIIGAFATISYIYSRKFAIQNGNLRIKEVTEQMSTIFARSAQAMGRAHLQISRNDALRGMLSKNATQKDSLEGLKVLRATLTDSSWASAEILDSSFNRIHILGAYREVEPEAYRGMVTGLAQGDSVIIGKIYVVDSFLYYPIISKLKGPANEQGYFLRWRQQRTSRESLEQFYLLLGDGATISVGNDDGSLWTNLYTSVPAPSLSGDNPLAMAKPIANTSWILHIALSEKDVLKPIRDSLNWMIFIGALLFLAGALITWVISRNITLPLRRLSKAASAVAAGDLASEVHSKRTDELGALAGSFNVMLQRIRTSYEQQEETVRLRTSELEEKLHQLQASEDRFKALLESAPDATIIVDSKGLIALVNKQTELVFGFSRDELIGNTVDVLLPVALRDKHAQHRTNFFASPKIRTMGLGLELFALKKDGTTIPVEISLSPIETAGGKFVAAAIRDISERKQTEDSIREVNRELESFTYSVSHDLRAPLRIIDGYADILKEDYADKFDEEGQRILSVVKSNARRMGQLIDDLLDLSRTSRKELAHDWISMRTIVDQVVDDLRQTYGGTARVDIGSLPTTMADASLIQQVWVNLISNAFKYSSKEKEPYISIVAEDMGSDYHFSVKDNGVGFDMAYADKLFGVFQRLHKASEFEGTGIGLALAYRIVKRHGGKIWVDSEPGKGTTFTFSLPKQ